MTVIIKWGDICFELVILDKKIDNEPVCTHMSHYWEVKPGGTGIQDYPQIHSESDTSQPGLHEIL